ncbi:MAG: OB-fold domain-containing protein, partial [Alphaproteobacteria bacterium]|nr:OB-fold domain-containing protein [Alphaproteobacteria bacterium]
LAEGPRMMSRVDNIAPEDVKIGMPVKARIVEEGEFPFVVFDPA